MRNTGIFLKLHNVRNIFLHNILIFLIFLAYYLQYFFVNFHYFHMTYCSISQRIFVLMPCVILTIFCLRNICNISVLFLQYSMLVILTALKQSVNYFIWIVCNFAVINVTKINTFRRKRWYDVKVDLVRPYWFDNRRIILKIVINQFPENYCYTVMLILVEDPLKQCSDKY